MSRMYPFMLFLITAVFFSSNVKAQWNEDVSENLLISEPEAGNQDMVQVGKTPDDKIFISWISWEDGNSYVKLQLLDKDGRALLEQGGMYVAKQPTPTWSSGYGFAVTQDGCAVVVNSDMRNNKWQPYAYKISQTGEHLWSADGVALLKENEGDGLNPHVCITHANNVLIGFQNVLGSNISVKVMKLLQDGTSAWGGKIVLSGSNGVFAMTPSGEDGVIVSYYEAFSSNDGNYVAMKYTANGEEAWASKAELDDSGAVKVTAEPCVISDGSGGIIAGWRYSASAFSIAGKAQRIDVNGNKVFADEGVLLDNLPTVATDLTYKYVYTCYSFQSGEEKNIKLYKFDEKGNLLWENNEISSVSASQFGVYGIVSVNDGVYVLYRNASQYNEATIEYTKVDLDGNIIARNVAVSKAPGDKGKGGLTPDFEDQFVVAWTDNGTQYGGHIYAQNVKAPLGASIKTVFLEKGNVFKVISGSSGNQVGFRVTTDCSMETSVSLTDLQGKTLARWEKVLLKEGTHEYFIPVDRLNAGMYLLSVNSAATRFSGKLAIK